MGDVVTKDRLLDIEEYKKRKAALARNNVITSPLARLDDDIIPRRSRTARGRKHKYTPTTLKNGINKYFDYIEQADEVPSIKGMMLYLKLYKESFYKYIKVAEYSDILEHARMIISEWCEKDVYKTRGQAAGKIAYMKNIHGWSDKIETNSTVEQKIITVDEARAKIEMLAPKLLDLLKNNMLVNQIGTVDKAGSVVEAQIESP